MSEQKKPSFAQKWKDGKINRAAVVTTVILIVAVAVIIAITVATNRSKDVETPKNDPPVTNLPTNDPPADTETPNTDKVPEDTQTPPPSTNVEEKLPSFILPVSGALSKKHDPKQQVWSQTMNDYRVHVGLDIVTEANAPVYASADGKVSRIWKDTRMGYCIAVEHSGDSYTIYKNLSETLPEGIKEGTTVRSGQLLATVGDSAMVEIGEEPHLHFEMTVADLMVDPLEYFDDKAIESLKIDASFGE